MSKLTKISRSDCDPIRKDLNDAIASVLAKYGLSGRFANATYTDTSVSFNKVLALGNNCSATAVACRLLASIRC